MVRKIAILLTCKVMEAGNQALKKGYLPRTVIRGMEKAVSKATEAINQNVLFLRSKEEVINVAGTAAKDRNIGLIIADCLEKVREIRSVDFWSENIQRRLELR